MQLRIVAVGRVREKYVAAACADFLTRLGPYFPVEVVEVRPSAAPSQDAAVREEGERILKIVSGENPVWLLDREGEQFTSEQLCAAIARVTNAGARRMTFIVAGTFGASAALRSRADFIWSLSKLTLLHEWARALVLEQLYRAAKIARNEPYHH